MPRVGISGAPAIHASSERLLFGVAPGSAWIAKRWSERSFAETCVWIAKTYGLEPAIIGTSGDPMVQRLRGELDERKLGYRAVLDLKDSASLESEMRKCRFVLSNDSFAAHLAEAVGVPIVALYSATHPDYGFGPTNEGSRAVHTDLWCSPCSKDGQMCFRIGSDRYRCREMISEDRVRKAIIEVMGIGTRSESTGAPKVTGR